MSQSQSWELLATKLLLKTLCNLLKTTANSNYVTKLAAYLFEFYALLK